MEIIDLTQKNDKVGGSANLPARPEDVLAKRTRASQNGIIRRTGDSLARNGLGDDGGMKSTDPRGRIGDRLVALGIITVDQLNVALQEKKISGKLLGQVLIELSFIQEDVLTKFLADSSGFEVFDPKTTIFDGDALALMTKEDAKKLRVLPVSYRDNIAVVALVDPYDIVATDSLRRILPKGTEIRSLVSTPSVLSEAIDAAYGYSSAIEDILKELEKDAAALDDLAKIKDDQAYSHPIVRLVNAFMCEAVKTGVSDLHFEPEENFVRLR